jgi:uncharacterized membrane protein
MNTERSERQSRADLWTSRLLRFGVLGCAALVAVGWALSLARSPSEAAAVSGLTRGGLLPEAGPFPSLANLAEGVVAGRGVAWVVAGLMLLIALPIVRVGLTAVLFAVERDWLYVILAVLVLALLIFGVLMGRAL